MGLYGTNRTIQCHKGLYVAICNHIWLYLTIWYHKIPYRTIVLRSCKTLMLLTSCEEKKVKNLFQQVNLCAAKCAHTSQTRKHDATIHDPNLHRTLPVWQGSSCKVVNNDKDSLIWNEDLNAARVGLGSEERIKQLALKSQKMKDV